MAANFQIRYLNEAEYPVWDDFVDHSPQGSIFSKTYWLQSVSDNFKIAGAFRNDELLAGIPFEEQKILNLKLLRTPELTQFSGFHFGQNEGMNFYKRISLERDLIEALLNFLEKIYRRLAINNHYSIQDIRPFIWKKYLPVVRYSYLLDLSNPAEIFDNMEHRTRYDIKKSAKKDIAILFNDDLSRFHELHQKTFRRQGKEAPVAFDGLEKIFNQLNSRNKCRIYFAEDKQGNSLSTAFIIWDMDIAYYLMGAVNPEFREQGSANLLLWQGMQDLSKMGIRLFDMYGANTPSIALFKRGFGGNLKTYYRLEKINSFALNAMLALKNIVSSPGKR